MPHADFNFVNPRDIVVVANEEWQDDDVSDIDLSSDLAPGDEEVMARVESTDKEIVLGIRAIGTTQHAADFRSIGVDQSVVLYDYQVKVDSPADEWNSLPGLSRDLPLGGIASPLGLIGGAYLGPLYAFRIKFTNRTDGESSPQTLSEEELGAEIHARVFRHGLAASDALPTDVAEEEGEEM